MTVILLGAQLFALFELVAISNQAEEVTLQQSHNLELMESLDRLIIQFALSWGALLEALLKRNSAALSESVNNQAKLTEKLDQLNKLAEKDTDLQKLMSEFSLLAERQNFMQRSLRSSFVENLDEDQYFKLVLETLTKRIGPFIKDFRQCQRTIETFRVQYAGQNVTSSVRREETRNRIAIVFILSCVGSNVLILWFIRRFIRRLNPLVTNAKKMRLNKPLQESVKGSDELAALDKVLVESSKYLYEAYLQRQQILDMIAHDIRAPLTSAKLAAEGLSRSSDGELDHRRLMNIESSLGMVLNMVGDLLENEKLRAGRFELELTEVSIAELIEQSVTLLSGQLQSKSIEVQLSLCKVDIVVDRSRMVQVLINILSNAIKFSPERGKIEILVEDHSGGVQFHVKDEGPGLDSAHPDIEKVFDEFYQLSKASDGFGLGLFISKKIIEAHGGRIWAHRSAGATGSIFSFELPNSEW